MLKKTYCFKYQSYFCHFGAKPSIQEYDTLEEAKYYQALNMRVNDDAYIGNIFVKKTVVITDADEAKRMAREEARKIKAEPKWNGVVTWWDGSKEVVYVDNSYYPARVYFRSDKTYTDLHSLDLTEGESLKVYDRVSNTLRLEYTGFLKGTEVLSRILRGLGLHQYSRAKMFVF